jgi:hypothetical protein
VMMRASRARKRANQLAFLTAPWTCMNLIDLCAAARDSSV